MSFMKLMSDEQLKQQDWEQTEEELKSFGKLGITKDSETVAVLIEPDFYEELFLTWLAHHIRLGNLVGDSE